MAKRTQAGPRGLPSFEKADPQYALLGRQVASILRERFGGKTLSIDGGKTNLAIAHEIFQDWQYGRQTVAEIHTNNIAIAWKYCQTLGQDDTQANARRAVHLVGGEIRASGMTTTGENPLFALPCRDIRVIGASSIDARQVYTLTPAESSVKKHLALGRDDPRSRPPSGIRAQSLLDLAQSRTIVFAVTSEKWCGPHGEPWLKVEELYDSPGSNLTEIILISCWDRIAAQIESAHEKRVDGIRAWASAADIKGWSPSVRCCAPGAIEPQEWSDLIEPDVFAQELRERLPDVHQEILVELRLARPASAP